MPTIDELMIQGAQALNVKRQADAKLKAEEERMEKERKLADVDRIISDMIAALGVDYLSPDMLSDAFLYNDDKLSGKVKLSIPGLAPMWIEIRREHREHKWTSHHFVVYSPNEYGKWAYSDFSRDMSTRDFAQALALAKESQLKRTAILNKLTCDRIMDDPEHRRDLIAGLTRGNDTMLALVLSVVSHIEHILQEVVVDERNYGED